MAAKQGPGVLFCLRVGRLVLGEPLASAALGEGGKRVLASAGVGGGGAGEGFPLILSPCFGKGLRHQGLQRIYKFRHGARAGFPKLYFYMLKQRKRYLAREGGTTRPHQD
jgi:hypothetical protein